MSKTVDIQPWLDYFGMIHKYEQQGFIEVKTDTHEAYVTQPALHAMTQGDDPMMQMRDGSIENTARRLRTYAAFKAQRGNAYLRQPFAIHVVQHEAPHDLLYTLFMSRRRWPLHKKDSIEIITYKDNVPDGSPSGENTTDK